MGVAGPDRRSELTGKSEELECSREYCERLKRRTPPPPPPPPPFRSSHAKQTLDGRQDRLLGDKSLCCGRRWWFVLSLRLRGGLGRYEREVNRCERSCLKRILEQDDSPARAMVLCVAAVHQGGGSMASGGGTSEQLVLELTDGWYGVRSSALPDDAALPVDPTAPQTAGLRELLRAVMGFIVCVCVCVCVCVRAHGRKEEEERMGWQGGTVGGGGALLAIETVLNLQRLKRPFRAAVCFRSGHPSTLSCRGLSVAGSWQWGIS